jgi:hypothetical protein
VFANSLISLHFCFLNIASNMKQKFILSFIFILLAVFSWAQAKRVAGVVTKEGATEALEQGV